MQSDSTVTPSLDVVLDGRLSASPLFVSQLTFAPYVLEEEIRAFAAAFGASRNQILPTVVVERVLLLLIMNRWQTVTGAEQSNMRLDHGVPSFIRTFLVENGISTNERNANNRTETSDKGDVEADGGNGVSPRVWGRGTGKGDNAPDSLGQQLLRGAQLLATCTVKAPQRSDPYRVLPREIVDDVRSWVDSLASPSTDVSRGISVSEEERRIAAVWHSESGSQNGYDAAEASRRGSRAPPGSEPYDEGESDEDGSKQSHGGGVNPRRPRYTIATIQSVDDQAGGAADVELLASVSIKALDSVVMSFSRVVVWDDVCSNLIREHTICTVREEQSTSYVVVPTTGKSYNPAKDRKPSFNACSTSSSSRENNHHQQQKNDPRGNRNGSSVAEENVEMNEGEAAAAVADLLCSSGTIPLEDEERAFIRQLHSTFADNVAIVPSAPPPSSSSTSTMLSSSPSMADNSQQSADSSGLIFTSCTGCVEVKVWDADTGLCFGNIFTSDGVSRVVRMAVTPDDRYLLVAMSGGQVVLIRIPSRNTLFNAHLSEADQENLYGAGGSYAQGGVSAASEETAEKVRRKMKEKKILVKSIRRKYGDRSAYFAALTKPPLHRSSGSGSHTGAGSLTAPNGGAGDASNSGSHARLQDYVIHTFQLRNPNGHRGMFSDTENRTALRSKSENVQTTRSRNNAEGRGDGVVRGPLSLAIQLKRVSSRDDLRINNAASPVDSDYDDANGVPSPSHSHASNGEGNNNNSSQMSVQVPPRAVSRHGNDARGTEGGGVNRYVMQGLSKKLGGSHSPNRHGARGSTSVFLSSFDFAQTVYCAAFGTVDGYVGLFTFERILHAFRHHLSRHADASVPAPKDTEKEWNMHALATIGKGESKRRHIPSALFSEPQAGDRRGNRPHAQLGHYGSADVNSVPLFFCEKLHEDSVVSVFLSVNDRCLISVGQSGKTVRTPLHMIVEGDRRQQQQAVDVHADKQVRMHGTKMRVVADVARARETAHSDFQAPMEVIHRSELLLQSPWTISKCFAHPHNVNILITTHVDECARVWSTIQKKLVHTFTSEPGGIASITFLPMQNQIAMLTGRMDIKVYDLEDYRLMSSVPVSNAAAPLATGMGGENGSSQVRKEVNRGALISYASARLVDSRKHQRASNRLAGGCVVWHPRRLRIVCCLRGPLQYEIKADAGLASAMSRGRSINAVNRTLMHAGSPEGEEHVEEEKVPAAASKNAPGNAGEIACEVKNAPPPVLLTSAVVRNHRSAVLDMAVHHRTMTLCSMDSRCMIVWDVFTGGWRLGVDAFAQARQLSKATCGESTNRAEKLSCCEWTTTRQVRLCTGTTNGDVMTWDPTTCSVLASESVSPESTAVTALAIKQNMQLVCSGQECTAWLSVGIHADPSGTFRRQCVARAVLPPNQLTSTSIAMACTVPGDLICAATTDCCLYFFSLTKDDPQALAQRMGANEKLAQLVERLTSAEKSSGRGSSDLDSPHGLKSSRNSTAGRRVSTRGQCITCQLLYCDDLQKHSTHSDAFSVEAAPKRSSRSARGLLGGRNSTAFDPGDSAEENGNPVVCGDDDRGAIVALLLANRRNQRLLLLVLDIGVIIVYDLVTREPLHRVRVLRRYAPSRVTCAAISPDEQLLFYGDSSGVVVAFDITLLSSPATVAAARMFTSATRDAANRLSSAFRLLSAFRGTTSQTSESSKRSARDPVEAAEDAEDQPSPVTSLRVHQDLRSGSCLLVIGAGSGEIRLFDLCIKAATHARSVSLEVAGRSKSPTTQPGALNAETSSLGSDPSKQTVSAVKNVNIPRVKLEETWFVGVFGENSWRLNDTETYRGGAAEVPLMDLWKPIDESDLKNERFLQTMLVAPPLDSSQKQNHQEPMLPPALPPSLSVSGEPEMEEGADRETSPGGKDIVEDDETSDAEAATPASPDPPNKGTDALLGDRLIFASGLFNSISRAGKDFASGQDHGESLELPAAKFDGLHMQSLSYNDLSSKSETQVPLQNHGNLPKASPGSAPQEYAGAITKESNAQTVLFTEDTWYNRYGNPLGALRPRESRQPQLNSSLSLHTSGRSRPASARPFSAGIPFVDNTSASLSTSFNASPLLLRSSLGRPVSLARLSVGEARRGRRPVSAAPLMGACTTEERMHQSQLWQKTLNLSSSGHTGSFHATSWGQAHAKRETLVSKGNGAGLVSGGDTNADGSPVGDSIEERVQAQLQRRIRARREEMEAMQRTYSNYEKLHEHAELSPQFSQGKWQQPAPRKRAEGSRSAGASSSGSPAATPRPPETLTAQDFLK